MDMSLSGQWSHDSLGSASHGNLTRKTGEIFDATFELNDENYDFTDQDTAWRRIC